MGRVVQVPTGLQGVVYRTLQKMSKSIGECAVSYDRATGSIGPFTDTTGNTPGYSVEGEFEVDTGYVPNREERLASNWTAKVYNVQGTFNGTSVQVGFQAIPMVSPNTNDTIKILVRMFGKNLTDYSGFTADWVLHEFDR